MTKKKVVTASKSMLPKQTAESKRESERERLKERMIYCLERDYLIVYIDETSVSNQDAKLTAWSLPKTNILIAPPQKNLRNHTAIAAICDHGLLHITVVDSWADSVKFQSFLDELYGKVSQERVAVFMDNASFHKVKAVKQKLLVEFEWLVIFNEAYKPQYNPIEKYFALVKQDYRKRLLRERVITNELTHKETQTDLPSLIK